MYILTGSHLAVVSVEDALVAEGPGLEGSVGRIVSANRFVSRGAGLQAVLLRLLRVLGLLDGVLHVFGGGDTRARSRRRRLVSGRAGLRAHDHAHQDKGCNQ